MHEDAFFELSKTTIEQFFQFFTIRGDAFDLGGSKVTHSELKTQNRYFNRIDPKLNNPTQLFQKLLAMSYKLIKVIHDQVLSQKPSLQ